MDVPDLAYPNVNATNSANYRIPPSSSGMSNNTGDQRAVSLL